MTYHLAIDIGASSGRHILGKIENDELVLEEIYRFENGISFQDNHYVWDIKKLYENIVTGILQTKKLDKRISSIAIDTWGVDYVLLDKDDKEILPSVSYRDDRTKDVPSAIYNLVSKEQLYSITGIQNYEYNTLFQLYCDKLSGKLDKAERLLMMPEYFTFKLTGQKKNEYTNCSTTNILDAKNRIWSKQILDQLGIKSSIFGALSSPSTYIGKLSQDLSNILGYEVDVLFAPSHDTASAVLSCPLEDDSIFISSGTWSLIGIESDLPITSNVAMEFGLSNEGGAGNKFCVLKNIMGMWLLQSIKKELSNAYTYDQLMNMAKSSDYTKTFDPTSSVFLNPSSMIDAIQNYLGEKLSINDILSSIYHSLAKSYATTIEDLETLTGKKFNSINIVGGGSKDDYLNNLTSIYSNKKVVAGPTECTALGNVISQMLYYDKNLDIKKARDLVIKTYKDEIKIYNP